MNNLLSKIGKLKKRIPFLQGENFSPEQSGTHHAVIISEKFVIRSREDNSDLLTRETEFLKKIEHELIPKVMWSGTIDGSFIMIENRLRGKTLDSAWKETSKIGQERIIQHLIVFLKDLRKQSKEKTYSVPTGKEYATFFHLLTDGAEKKIEIVKKFSPAVDILHTIKAIIVDRRNKKFFSDQKKAIVHGDLINHNLLIDADKLTGVLDWELAIYGDPDYDLCRLFYYQECAMAYQEQGDDSSYEADYMDKLISAIEKSDLVSDRIMLERKYHFIRAIFYLNAFSWAATSDAPEENFEELIALWNKKGGAKH